MNRLSLKPKVLRVAVGVIWLALLVLVALQFRWSKDLSDAYLERVNHAIARSTASFRQSFDADLRALCTDVQNELYPESPIPYKVYYVDAQMAELSRLNPQTLEFEPVSWPAAWRQLPAELLHYEDLMSLTSARRWYARPWVAAQTAAVFYRAASRKKAVVEEPSPERMAGVFIVAPELEQIGVRYLHPLQSRLFAGGLVESRLVVSFAGQVLFDSHPNVKTAAHSEGELLPDGMSTQWRVRVAPLPGALDAEVAALRIRSLGTGLAVSFVLLAGTFLLSHNARQAQQLNARQTAFVAGVSHELRTPITAITMLASNLKDGITDLEQAQQYGGLIAEQGERLRARVEEILAFAAGRSESILLEPLMLPPLVDEVLQQERNLLREFELDCRLDADLPMAMADRSLLASCLSNLVANAAKYAGEGKWLGLVVTTEGERGTIRITVADRGPGIAAEEQAHLFEPFYRGRAAKSGRHAGSGLGLHLVQTRVEAMGGKVRVESTLGRGTAFHITLRSATE
jgi:signal transduction histidine kinase